MSDDPRPRSSDDPALPADSGEGRDPRGSLLGRLLGAFSADPEEEGERDAAPTAGAPRIANLRRMRVDDVAVPKVEIVAAPEDASLEALTGLFREHGFSRLPIYRGTLDSPLGMVHLKDLALTYGFGATPGPLDLKAMLRPLLYVPPSMPIGVLLAQMQRERIHMALVIDEYGGVDGLLTLEDLIEQVLGEIDDEHDEFEGHLWAEEKPGVWLIQGRAEVDEVEAATGLTLLPEALEDEVDTIAGLAVLLAGRVPRPGAVMETAGGHRLEVVEADTRRVKKVRLRA